MNMFNNNKEVWSAYDSAVVELNNLNEKLSRAMSSYEMWLEKALACEDNDEYNNLVDNKVCPKWYKVVRIKEKVNAAEVKLGKIKARITWSERLGKYKKVEGEDSWGFEMVSYN